jgi:hypothetical protein
VHGPLPDRLTRPLFVPSYRLAASGDWELRQADMVLAKGYWSPAAIVHGMTALMRGGDTWMSITPMEIESQEIGVRLAEGHVVVFGMGMGWAAAASAAIPEVTAVTVVERDPDVLALHRELDVFAQLPETARAKVRIETGDAYDWRPDAPVDVLMADIWLPLVSDGRVEEVRRMQANVRARAVYFWGQEMEIARHAVAAGRALDSAGIAATIGDFGLPLLGPELPDYPAKVEAAARQWMRDRWFPGAAPPFA